MNTGILTVIAILAFACAPGRAVIDRDTTIVADPDMRPEITEALIIAIDAWQPAVRYKLTVVVSDRQGPFDWYVYEAGRVPDDLPPDTVGRTRAREDLRLIQIFDSIRDDEIQSTLYHETGHMLGLDHEDGECAPEGEGVMRTHVDARGLTPAKCELDALREVYR